MTSDRTVQGQGTLDTITGNAKDTTEQWIFTLAIVQIEEQRGKSFFQVLRKAKGKYWSAEGPEFCDCETDERQFCPFIQHGR